MTLGILQKPLSTPANQLRSIRTVWMIIVFHAVFLSLPSSKTDSPVNTRFSGILFCVIDLDRACPEPAASVDGRLRIGDGGMAVEGEVPKRPLRGEPSDVLLALGDAGDMLYAPEVARAEDGEARNCSRISFICQAFQQCPSAI